MESDRPKVGIGILILKDNHVLLGKRLSTHGYGEYALPGGHLENGESIEACVLRELAEEVGPKVKCTPPRFLCVTNLRRYMPKHYIDIGMAVYWLAGEPKRMEPDKNAGWSWYPLHILPSPVFGCINNYIEAYMSGKNYFLE